ncbi:MAG: low molecular weight protein-tyrosine-phosphatase [Naasia sp.]
MSDGRAAAIPAARSAAGPYAVTFVCTGNICRSPMADVIVRELAQQRGMADLVRVTSSGTGGWHVGDGADSRAVATLDRHGYDGTPHRARRFDASLFESYDLVVAMDRSHLEALRSLAPDDEASRRIIPLREFDPEDGDEVPDPYYGDADDFEAVLRMIERSAQHLVDEIERVAPQHS